MKQRTRNEESYINFISSNKPTFSWNQTLNFLLIISSHYYAQINTQIGKRLCESMTEAATLYRNNFYDAYITEFHKETMIDFRPLHNMSHAFITSSTWQFKALDPIKTFTSSRTKWLNILLHNGIPHDLLKN